MRGCPMRELLFGSSCVSAKFRFRRREILLYPISYKRICYLKIFVRIHNKKCRNAVTKTVINAVTLEIVLFTEDVIVCDDGIFIQLLTFWTLFLGPEDGDRVQSPKRCF
jgi:hypothetical protein